MGIAREFTRSLDQLLIPGKSTNIYSTQDHTTPLYVRNTNLWAASLDLTCMSPWNSVHSGDGAGTLVSPSFILSAHHFSPEGTIRFISANGTIHTRTLVADAWVATDVRVMKLSSPLPSEIKPAKILPANWTDYLPSDISGLPVLIGDKEEKALCGSLDNLDGTRISYNQPQADSKRRALYEIPANGDSSNGVFLYLGTQPVIVTMLHQYANGGVGAVGDSIHFYKSIIEAAMVSLGSAETLTTIDLSGYQRVFEFGNVTSVVVQ